MFFECLLFFGNDQEDGPPRPAPGARPAGAQAAKPWLRGRYDWLVGLGFFSTGKVGQAIDHELTWILPTGGNHSTEKISFLCSLSLSLCNAKFFSTTLLCWDLAYCLLRFWCLRPHLVFVNSFLSKPSHLITILNEGGEGYYAGSLQSVSVIYEQIRNCSLDFHVCMICCAPEEYLCRSF